MCYYIHIFIYLYLLTTFISYIDTCNIDIIRKLGRGIYHENEFGKIYLKNNEKYQIWKCIKNIKI